VWPARLARKIGSTLALKNSKSSPADGVDAGWPVNEPAANTDAHATAIA
jgi:hypothetical protein